ncbi:MAG: type I-E CRISPR-associated protein Cas5/CasD [Thermodesulfobacteriota bacterium]
MAAYLILTLDGVFQAWGGHTYETFRPTELFPTRSGLTGLFAACLGIRRHEKGPLRSLAGNFRYAARRDLMPGRKPDRMTDYHTVQNVRTVKGKPKDTELTHRQYLEDTIFSLAVHFLDNKILGEVTAAIQKPALTPYLGRKSCLLNRPLFNKVAEADSLEHALLQTPPSSGIVYSEEPGPSISPMRVRDVPLYEKSRAFETRTIYIYTMEVDHAH